ncbi:MAG TPA: hypothetical protein VMZ04_09780 [Anaerolineae bacterium]|nr:hypothetical protein [Anaerolineae bacterium]
MSTECIFFKLGKRLGYWYAANSHSLKSHLIRSMVSRLPGGRWLLRFLR